MRRTFALLIASLLTSPLLAADVKQFGAEGDGLTEPVGYTPMVRKNRAYTRQARILSDFGP